LGTTPAANRKDGSERGEKKPVSSTIQGEKRQGERGWELRSLERGDKPDNFSVNQAVDGHSEDNKCLQRTSPGKGVSKHPPHTRKKNPHKGKKLAQSRSPKTTSGSKASAAPVGTECQFRRLEGVWAQREPGPGTDEGSKGTETSGQRNVSFTVR